MSPAELFAQMTYAVVFLVRHVNVPEGRPCEFTYKP